MGVAFISAYCGGKLVSKNKCLYLYTDLIYQSIVIVCMMQALLGIVQYFDFFRICTNFPVVGSFENPAGFVSCICSGLPFANIIAEVILNLRHCQNHSEPSSRFKGHCARMFERSASNNFSYIAKRSEFRSTP